GRSLLGRRLHAGHWPTAPRCNAGAGARGVASLYSANARNVPVEDAGRALGFIHGSSASGGAGRWREDEVVPSAGSHQPRSTDRLRECGKPAFGTRDDAAEGNGGARGARRGTREDRPATVDGKRDLGRVWGGVGDAARGGRPRVAEDDSAGRHPAARNGSDGLARHGVYNRDRDSHRARFWSCSGAPRLTNRLDRIPENGTATFSSGNESPAAQRAGDRGSGAGRCAGDCRWSDG